MLNNKLNNENIFGKQLVLCVLLNDQKHWKKKRHCNISNEKLDENYDYFVVKCCLGKISENWKSRLN